MFGSRSRALAIVTAVAVSLTACSDDQRTFPMEAGGALDAKSGGMGVFHRYVAIGTSVSMGVQGDGVIAATQATSWPAQLSAMAGRELTAPYLDGTGCRSPLIAPLASGLRLSGEGAGANPATLSCSQLRADVELPVRNIAINAALTRDALFTTPENIADPGYIQLYQRVLLPGATQVSTMMSLNPKLVSVELGANEVLNTRTGIAIPGVTMFPYAAWQPLYDAVLDSVDKVTKMAVLVGLINDVRTFAAFRTGDELWANRAEFALFNVAVSNDCQNNSNLLFVPVRVPTAVGTGAFYAQNHLGQYTLSCAAGGPATLDYVLDANEIAIVNNQMHAMSAHIQAEAARRGYAYFELGALYDRSDLKPPFSVVGVMTTAAPYGQYISLDGLHPNALGATVLANAAARALNATYGFGIE